MPGIFIAQTNPQRQSVTVNSSLNAVLNTEGAQTAVLFVTSTSSLAGVWEGTFEDIERLVNNAAVGESGADWFDLPSLQTNDAAVTSKLPLATVTVADDDVLFAATMGAKYVRFRRTAGSGTCDLAVSNVSLDDIAKAAGQTQAVSITQPDAIVGPADPVIDSYTYKAINLTTGANQVLASSAASKQIWVYGYGYTVGDADGQTVSFQDEDDVALSGIMEHVRYGGMSVSPSGNFAMPIWKLGTDKDLEVDITGGDVDGWICYAVVSV